MLRKAGDNSEIFFKENNVSDLKNKINI